MISYKEQRRSYKEQADAKRAQASRAARDAETEKALVASMDTSIQEAKTRLSLLDVDTGQG